MKTTKRILSLLLCMALILGIVPVFASAAEETTLATFNFPTSSSTTSWNDGTEIKSEVSFTDGDYTLTFTNYSKVYQKANDANGVGFIKFGTSSVVGSLTFTVPEDVTRVELQLASYKANASKYSINGGTAAQIAEVGTKTTIGTPDVVSIDTSSQKTVTVSTVSGGLRMVMVSVVFYGESAAGGETPVCEHANLNDPIHVDGKHVVTCADCDEIQATEEVITTTYDENNHTTACSCGEYTVTEAHTLSDWTVKTPATAAAPGEEIKTCSGCEYTMSQEIPQLAITGNHYIKYTNATLLSGTYILIAGGYAMGVLDGSWILNTQAPVIDENTVADDMGGVWTLTVTDAGVMLTDPNGKNIAPPAGAANNSIKEGDYVWAYTYDEATGTYSFAGVGSDASTLALNTDANNGLNRFRAYKNTTLASNTTGTYITDFTLYKLEGEQSCAHETAYTTTATTHIAYCSKCSEVFIEETWHDMKGENGTCSVCDYAVDADVLTAAWLELLFALESGEKLEGNYMLTGTVTEINYTFDASYKNMSVTIAIEGYDNTIYCYHMKCTADQAAAIYVGGEITVEGPFENYNGTYEINGGTLISMVPCEHVYDYDCDAECNVCGATREASHQYYYPCDPVCMICYEITNPDATHTIVAVEAKAATCTENGNVAYWYCEHCAAAWTDEALTQLTNLKSVVIPAPGHTYDDNCDFDCNVCEEFREAPHNLTTHVEA
ncbi:MAG: hypothetical protein E7455_08050, partial [Ruminococcaceae bacterium]|nr:hypothetical protein [Oscillospiraceae bacterium]